MVPLLRGERRLKLKQALARWDKALRVFEITHPGF